jgi:Na+-driven multidrug efflux pump
MNWRPDWTVIRQLFRFGLPAGAQGIAMNSGGVFMLRSIGSLEHSGEAQAAFAVGYTELFSLITWTSVGLMGAAATVAGQNLGAGRRIALARRARRRVDRLGVAAGGSCSL